MGSKEPLVKDYMTLQPHTIEHGENVQTAHQVMTKLGIRHLPVMKKGSIIGILSEREVNFAIGIESIDHKQILAIDVCSQKPYMVTPETALRDVADVMAKKHFGSVIVMKNDELVGIVTTVDVCRALAQIIALQNRPAKTAKDSSFNRLKKQR